MTPQEAFQLLKQAKEHQTALVTNCLNEIKAELNSEFLHQPVKKDILIVVRNELPYVKACIESIYKNTDNFNIYIWDNGSDEETKDYLKSQNFAYVHYESENKGFIEPNNWLAKQTSSPYIILLNSDTVVSPYWDTTMIGWLQQHSDIALVGYGGGMLDSECMGGKLDHGFGVDFIQGWCLCLPRWVYDSFGLFDSKNLEFAYGEDADLSLRVKEAGKKVYALYSNLVFHVGNITVKQVLEEKGFTEMCSTFEKNHAYLKKRWQSCLTSPSLQGGGD